MTEVRFGLSLPLPATPGVDPGAEARAAEDLGFDLVSTWDHLHGDHPSFETWTALTWMAARTSRVMLLPSVLGLPYRSPPVVAKMAETLDRLCGGRLVLGLGGGGSDAEFEAFGLSVRSAGQKVEALSEAIEIIKGLWVHPTFTFHGRHFAVHEARIEPRPLRPIPIWTGSYGRRSLGVTGRQADGWNPSLPFAQPEVASRMRDVIRRAAAEVGRDPDSITCAYNVGVRIQEAASPDSRIVAGGPEQIAERLAGFVSIGFTTLILWIRGNRESRERVANEVLPAVRALVA